MYFDNTLHKILCEGIYTGEQTLVHPVIKVAPSHEDYMKWSFRINGKHEDEATTIHLKDTTMTINHKSVDKSIRNPEDGRKRPIILLKGEIVEIDFDETELQQKVQGWVPVTYNPHKHPEVVFTDSLPDWWCNEIDFQDKLPRQQFNVDRREAMVRYADHPDQPTQVTTRSGDKSVLVAKEAILKQHKVCDEDYMWVKF